MMQLTMTEKLNFRQDKYTTYWSSIHPSIQFLEHLTHIRKKEKERKKDREWVCVTGEDDVLQEAAPQVDVWAQDGLEEALMHPTMVPSNQLGLKENLWGTGGGGERGGGE